MKNEARQGGKMYRQFGDWVMAVTAFCRAAGYGGGYHPAAMEGNIGRFVPAAPDVPGLWGWMAVSWGEAVRRAEPDGGPGPQPVEFSYHGYSWFLRWVSARGTVVVLRPVIGGWELTVEPDSGRGEEGERSARERFEYAVGVK